MSGPCSYNTRNATNAYIDGYSERGAFMARDERYREQTEEDLKNVSPMSAMQKVILAAAAVILAAIVAYIAFN